MLTATKPANAVKNHRKWSRKKPRSTAKVECRRGSFGLGPNLAVELLDISETGIGLILNVPLKPRDEVEVVIPGHGQRKTIKQIARVCWCLQLQDNRFCAGLTFDKWLPFADVQYVARP